VPILAATDPLRPPARPRCAEPTIIGQRDGKDVVTVRPGEATQSKQGLPNSVGISGATAGAKHLSLLKVVIPPGGSAEAQATSRQSI
jgi:uncharacterized RmlC-like cupin family protein